MRRRAGVPAVALAVVLLFGGCGLGGGMAFREDTRLSILEPADRATVPLPVTLRWTTEDIDLGSPGGPQRFAVFVDRAPLRPGQHLRALGDDDCERVPGCPDEAYLRERYVYLTTESSLVLESVPDQRSSNRTGAEDRHEAVIVLLDAEGRRMGEAAWSAEFSVDRGTEGPS
ncbi:MAG TPA: hypothetical protein VHF47_00620 [Acidimicrobiales bacterium]|nr:hypothetical protein [Acidimicrobiales bacterium]